MNGRVTAVTRPFINIMFHGCHFAAILEFVIRFVSNSYRFCPVLFCAILKSDVSISNRFPEVYKRAYTQTHRHTRG